MVQESLQVAGNPTSPARISFSYDLRCNSDALPASPPLAAADFDFCVRRSCDHDSPSAAELFADGKIVPAEIRKKTQMPKSPPKIPEIEDVAGTGKKQSSDETEEREKQSQGGQNGRSFWGFKRSSSVTGYGASRLCPLPLPLLSRSNSTGSKRAQKTTSVGDNIQKPPLKKSYGGVRVSPVVLHVPVVNIFGRGSIFSGSSNGRDHKSKISNNNK